MVRSSKAGEQAIDKLVQLLRSTLCVFMLVGSASTFAGQNILYYSSQAGDWIGGGKEVRFNGADGTFNAYASSSTLGARFFSTRYTHWWCLRIATADGAGRHARAS